MDGRMDDWCLTAASAERGYLEPLDAITSYTNKYLSYKEERKV